MASTDVELEQQLKEAGKQLSHPSDSTEALLYVLDHVERLLSKIDQSPKKSMLDALKPLMKALIQDSLMKHSDVDTKVAVASCISDITRITAPDAPYDDDQMRDVFQLIVDSFEDLDDQYSRSFHKRAAILETVSKVRSCVIMLDLECDGMIVEMFEHFLKFVRNYHLESIIYSSMENIMVLVLEESEDISVEMLKPLLATVRKDSEGVLPIARKLGEGVLLKSADKLKPYLKPAVISLGDTLENYTKIVASICEGTTATFRHDENDSGPQKENESKLEKGSTDEEQQVDDSKVTTASSEHTEQVVKEDDVPSQANPTPTIDRSPKSVMSNGVNVKDNEEASVDQEISKNQEQEVIINQENVHKEQSDDDDDDDDSDAEEKSKHDEEISKLEEEKSKLEEEKSKLEEEKIKLEEGTSENKGKKDDIVTNLTEISDSSHIEGEKEESNKPSSEIEKDNDVKESEIENEKENDVKMSEIEKDNDDDGDDDDDVEVSSPKPIESKPASVTVTSPTQSNSIPDEISVKKTVGTKKKQTPEQEEISSPSKSETNPSEETHVKKPGRPKKNLTREDPTEETSAADVDAKPQKRAGKKTVAAKEVKQVSKDESDDSDSDAEKKEVKQVSKDESDDSDSDVKPLKKPVSKSTKRSGKKSKQSDAKKAKQSGKKVEDSDSDAKPLKQSVKKGDKGKITVDEDENESDDDSDAEPLKQSVKKGDKNKVTVEEDSESDDSDAKPSKTSAKKGNLSKKKDEGKKRASGKNVAEKDQSSDDEMDSSPKSATKSAKRKRSAGKDKVSDTIKYDKSLVGKKVKVWWPEDKMYYEGVVESFDSAKKKHKVSYVDGDEEKLNLKTQRWEIIPEFSVRDEVNVDQSEEASPETHKKKKSKTDSASQEKVKDSSKKGAKGSALKDNKSKEAGKSKEDKETPKTVNKSKGKSNSNGPTKAKETEDVKTPESAKGKSTGSKKRKKRS